MTRDEIKTIKKGQSLYVPIITKCYSHGTGNSIIGSYEYSMYELFHLKVEDIRIFDYNDFLIKNGHNYIIEDIEKSKIKALQQRKELEEKGELEDWQKEMALVPWWYEMKTIIIKFDLSGLDENTRESFNNTYSQYNPTFFNDAAYPPYYDSNNDMIKAYKNYLSFPLWNRNGEKNEEDFKETYSGRALSLFSKTKKEGNRIVKKENQVWLKYIDGEIKYLKDVKKKIVTYSKKDNILI